MKAGTKMTQKHLVSLKDAHLAGLTFGTAKNGNAYASGIALLYDEEGRYQTGLQFLCFSKALGALRILEQQIHSAELTGESGKPARPTANISGWFKTGKDGREFRKSPTFYIESVDEIVDVAEDSTL